MADLRFDRKTEMNAVTPTTYLTEKFDEFEDEIEHRDEIIEDFLQEIEDAVFQCSGSSMEVCNITVSQEFFTYLGKYFERKQEFAGRAFKEPHDQVQIYGVVVESSDYFRHSPEKPPVRVRCEECAQEPLWSEDGPYCPICD